MNTPTELDRLRDYLSAPTDGIIGLVDAILALSRRWDDVRVEEPGKSLRLKLTGGAGSQDVEFNLRRPLLRAALARVAVIVSDDRHAPFSPYEGEGEIVLEGEPSTRVHVRWANTTREQSLMLVAVRPAPDRAVNGHHSEPLPRPADPPRT